MRSIEFVQDASCSFTFNRVPLGVFILKDFIQMVPEELSNSARIDGCSEHAIFSRIIVPLTKPALATVAIVNFIPVWNDF